jgi:hypothetical protein
MAMARRRQARRQALDFAMCSNPEKNTDWDRFIRTGDIGMPSSGGLTTITPRIAYHIRRIKANDNHFVLDDGSDPFVDPFDPEDN